MSEHIYDTTYMQIMSVVKVGEAMGWKFNGRSFEKKCYDRWSKKRKTHFCSFQEMQLCHNGAWKATNSYTDPVWCPNIEAIDLDTYEELKQSKLVSRTKVQYSKKLKRFVCQNNLIEVL